MAFTIKYYEAGRPTGDEHWTGIFGEARALAQNAVTTGAAEKVEIRDEAGQLIFQYPEAQEPSR